MSYILDALKKSERKQQRGSVPDLLTVHDTLPRKPDKRYLWKYLIVAALLLNAGILLLWLSPRDSEKQEGVAESTSLKQHEAGAIKPEKGVAGTRLPVSAPYHPMDKLIEPKGTDTAEEPLPVSETTTNKTALDKMEDMQQTFPVETANDKQTKTLRDAALPGPSGKKPETSPIKKKQDGVMITNQIDSPPASDNAMASEQGILTLNELPLSVRQALPDLTITGHIYSNEPSSRVININGRIIREGEVVANGLKVEEITAKGVIFRYRDYRFSMKRF